MRTLLLLTSATVLALLAACGDDSAASDDDDCDCRAGEVDDTTVDCNPTFGTSDACGGELSGSWQYRRACTDFDAEAALRDACPGARVTRTQPGVSGSLSFVSALWQHSGGWSHTVDATLPALCAAAVGGCDSIPTILRDNGASEASCSGAGECACSVTWTGRHTAAGLVSTDDGIATLPSGERYPYCVDGDTLTYREIRPDGEIGVTFTLTR